MEYHRFRVHHCVHNRWKSVTHSSSCPESRRFKLGQWEGGQGSMHGICPAMPHTAELMYTLPLSSSASTGDTSAAA
jgi:hypothetical protein